ncbi:unnamed protein product [Cylindrotheca closterium]|uniref:Glycosyltransferase 2-like domain-containing protein n=1 Tax=Cylindrotheca closterium TaxID=2856 RepID=A0AAD2FR95_9STRA|nr:unnamed protein product [Cylindrotheca closterium]
MRCLGRVARVIFGLLLVAVVVSTNTKLLLRIRWEDVVQDDFLVGEPARIHDSNVHHRGRASETADLQEGGAPNKDTLVIGRRYSAKACHLSPPWGMPSEWTVQNSCVGKDIPSPFTTARHLTCDDDKPSDILRSNGVTVALLHFANPSMLLRQLQTFASYPMEVQKQLTILVVDDGSPPGLRSVDYISAGMYESHFRLRIAQITTDKAWNIGGARNLAFHIADTSSVFLLDLDMVVPLETMHSLLTWEVRNSSHSIAHRFNRRKPNGKTGKHPAVALLDTAAYWESGGCDEDFCGRYGFTDVHFWKRWKASERKVLRDRMKHFINEVDQIPCDETYIINPATLQNCTDTLKTLKLPSKNREPNRKLLQKKSVDGCWSNRFLRFQWVLQL